jgi:hypothetical protein
VGKSVAVPETRNRRGRRAVLKWGRALVVIAVLALGACGQAPATDTTATGGFPPTASPGGAALSTVGPRPTPPGLVELCRRTIFMNPDGGTRLTDEERRATRVALQHEDQGTLYALFSTGSRDATCVAYSLRGFPSLRAFLWGEPFPSYLTPDKPLVVGPVGGDSELGIGYAWGAVGPGVARVTITDAGGRSADAVIQDSYFLGLLHTDQCCTFTIVAYDAAGNTLASRE